MKIAVASTGEGLDSQISMIFGRCPQFVIVEIEGKEIKDSKTIQNTAVGQMGGAGITAAQIVGNEKVEVVITGAMGPRAFDVMNQLGIKVFSAVPGTVRDNVQQFIDGKLKELTTPGPMYRGMGPGRGFGRGFAPGRGFGQGRGRRRQW